MFLPCLSQSLIFLQIEKTGLSSIKTLQEIALKRCSRQDDDSACAISLTRWETHAATLAAQHGILSQPGDKKAEASNSRLLPQ